MENKVAQQSKESVAYEAPKLEMVLQPEDFEREVFYAGDQVSIPTV